MSKMSRLKRDQINEAVEGKNLTGEQKEEQKLQNVMDEDAMITDVYKEVYEEVRYQDQGETDYLRSLHEKFDYYFDDELMEDKLPTEMYDLKQWDIDNEPQYSTDFTDENEDVQYKRYKLIKFQNTETAKEYFETIALLQREADTWLDTLPEEHYARNKHGEIVSTQADTVLMKYREKKADAEKIVAAAEVRIAEMKYQKTLRQRNELEELFDTNDLMFGDSRLNFKNREELKNDPNWHPEFKKAAYSNLPEDNDPSIQNEEDAQNYEAMQDAHFGWYKAKQTYLDDLYDNQLQLMTKNLEENQKQLGYEDERMEEKLDYMYHSLDYDNDRRVVRDKFLKEVNKRTTLADVGETLDKLVIDSKAA